MPPPEGAELPVRVVWATFIVPEFTVPPPVLSMPPPLKATLSLSTQLVMLTVPPLAFAMVLAPLAFAAWIAPRSEHPAVALAHALATTVSDVFLTVYRKVICAFAGTAKAPNPISATRNARNLRLPKEALAKPDGAISP